VKRFKLYRPNPPENYVRDGYATDLDKPQLEGIVFSDGTVAIRWCTATSSTSIWSTLEDFKKIHGHEEYGTIWEWLD
jgi:hypothetical protein